MAFAIGDRVNVLPVSSDMRAAVPGRVVDVVSREAVTLYSVRYWRHDASMIGYDTALLFEDELEAVAPPP